MSESGADRRPRATIRDVAALAGVGTKTVSRVVNEEANVSAATRTRVQRAIQTLSYRPHLGAGALRRSDGRTLTVGLLLDAVDNSFSAGINRGVEVVAAARGTAVFAASTDDDPERERRLVEAFSRRRVDGLILTPIADDQGYLADEGDQGTPIVLVDRLPVGLVADAVVSDNHPASLLAVRHLLALGHRRVAYLGDDLTIFTARERRRGYGDAMREAGLAGEAVYRDGLRSDAEAYRALSALLAGSEPPTAVFSSQNEITIGALRALHDQGRHEDVAQVGFDEVPLSDLIQPAVTVVAQDPRRIGTIAAERMFARMDGDRSAAQTIVVPTTLIPRGSGEIPPP